MKNLTFSIILLAFLSFSMMEAQNISLNKNAAFVFFNDQELVFILEDIIREENSCKKQKKNINWYVDFKEEYNSIIITQGRIENLIELNEGKKKIYTTTINDNIVFVFMKNQDDKFLSKTGFYIDLSSFLNKSTLVFEDFSAWLIKYNNRVYKLMDSQIRKCD